MKTARFGRLGLALCLLLLGQTARAEDAFTTRLNALQEDWQEAYYLAPDGEKADRLEVLLGSSEQLRRDYPQRAEAWIVQAIVLCVYSGVSWGLDALTNIDRARQLLLKAKEIDPRAMEGSAYVTLGALYYQVPGWPVSFGDDETARGYLQAALRLFPDALDTNYFYGDFLAGQDQYEEAYPYLEKAAKAPIRANLAISDRQLKRDVDKLLLRVRRKLPYRMSRADG